MAEYKVQKTGPGVVIFFGVVALIFMVLAAGELYSSLLRDSKPVTIYFDSVSGVKERTKVTYAGRKCGQVVKLVDLSKPKKDDPAGKSYYVEVTASIDKKTPVNSKTKALVTMVGMLGEKELDLTPGDPEAPELAPGEGLYGESGGIDILINTARKLVVKLDPLLDSIQAALANVNDVIKDPTFKQDIKTTIAQARTTLETTDATLKEAKAMLGENRDNIKTVLGNARELTEKGKTTLATVNDTLGETRPKLQTLIASIQKLTSELQPKLNELMAKSNGTLDKAAVTIDKAGELMDTTNSLLSDNRETITMMLTSLRETGYNAKHLTHTFRMIFAPWSIFCSQKKPDATKQPEPGTAAKAPAAAEPAAPADAKK